MGCDIHTYVEYSTFDTQEGDPYWDCFIVNGGSRDYLMFGILAGVRVEGVQRFPLRGLPDGPLSYHVRGDAYLSIVDECGEREGVCTEADVAQWNEPVFDLGGVRVCNHPDNHSASWITADELAIALGAYMTSGEGRCYSVEWDATLAAMRSFEKGGAKTRMIFWFDN